MATLLAGAALSLAVVTQPMARQDAAGGPGEVQFLGAHVMAESPRGMARSAQGFVRAMAEGDADALWMFASEEEHAAFQTEPAAYRAYASDFPALTKAEDATFVRAWNEGELSFVSMIVRDAAGGANRAELGLWLSDAGDWQVASLSVVPAADSVAGL
jgi:hypothetical protein